jgi:hypothetical protein
MLIKNKNNLQQATKHGFNKLHRYIYLFNSPLILRIGFVGVIISVSELASMLQGMIKCGTHLRCYLKHVSKPCSQTQTMLNCM